MMYSQQQARLQGQPLKLQPGQQAKMIPRPGVPGGQVLIQGQVKPAVGMPIQAHKEKRKYDSLK